MFRCVVCLGALLVASSNQSLHADAFDRYVNPVLAKVPAAPGAKELKQLTPDLIADHDRVLTGTSGALIVVKTNAGRYSKLLVQAARQKLTANMPTPILLIERYATYREGQERAIEAEGKNVSLFDGFHFNLDIGQ